MTLSLRTYQQDQMAEPLREAFRAGYRAPLLVAPTASGKTAVFCHIAMSAALKGTRILILVHRKELWAQTSETLNKYGAGHGIIARGQPFTDSMIQVASVQTLVRRMTKIQWMPDLIVIDEGHHAVAGSTYSKIIEHYGNPKLISVTATAERLDSKGLGVDAGGFADTLVMGPTVRELIDAGYLCPPVVYAPSQPDMTGTPTRMGDWARGATETIMDKPRLVGDAVKHYRALAHNEPAIAFCVSIRHAEHTAEQFRAAGYKAESIDGKLDNATRKKRIDDLGAGRLHVLTSCDLISEGTDVPIVSVGLLLRPTQSLALFLQQTGRILRISPGKERALILDFSGNVYRHGFVDDDRQWSLEGRTKQTKRDAEAAIAIRQCPTCYHVFRPAPECPKCGFELPIKAREIEQVDGELQQLDPKAIRRTERAQEREARTYADLFALAQERGYKSPGAFATKRMMGRAKSMDDLIQLGRDSGKGNPKAWAGFMWRSVLPKIRGRRAA